MHDVVIIGGGPAGLFLACELRLAGAAPVVLERLERPDLSDKAHGLAGQVVRLLDQRGLYERCGGRGVPVPAPGFYFAGFPLPLTILGDDNPLFLLPIDQSALEAVLTERAQELGVEIHRGWTVTGLVQDEHRVEVTAEDPAGAVRSLHARYVVGCDGARSITRKQAGIAFPGSRDDHVVDRWAQVRASDSLEMLPGGRVRVAGLGDIPAHFHRTETGVFTLLGRDVAAPIIATAEWETSPGESSSGSGTPMTLHEMEDSIERVLGVHLPLEPPVAPAGLLRRLVGRNTRLADRYRNGRIFVAGDAAHTSHGPTLNLALQDAANLAWKLGAAIAGWAPDHLLDSYETERHASGARELMWTQAETALMAPGPDVTALRQLFSELLGSPDNLRQIATQMAGADVRYDMAPDTTDSTTGRFVPDFILTTATGAETRVAELLREGRGLLIDVTSDHRLRTVVGSRLDHVTYLHATAVDPVHDSLLIRPDGYVAWSGNNPATAETALTYWFGPDGWSATDSRRTGTGRRADEVGDTRRQASAG